MRGGVAALTGALALAAALLVLPQGPRPGAVATAPASGGPPGRRAWRILLGRWRGGGSAADDTRLLALLDVLVPALRAGLPVALALAETDAGAWGRENPAAGARPPGWVAELTHRLGVEAASGRPLARTWAVHAAAAGSVEGAFVARAWELSETLGAPLAESVAEAATAVRQRIARTQRLEVVTAGPRATARVLTLLPLAGPVVATVMGVSFTQLYSGIGAVSAATGLVLLLLGRAWCARLLRGVTRPVAASETG